MTGFGSASAMIDGLCISVEVNGVNRRVLEIQASLPKEWQPMESEITNLVRKSISRGKVNIYIQTSTPNNEEGIYWDAHGVELYLKKIKDFCEDQGIEYSPDANFVFKVSKFLQETGKMGVLPELSVVEELVKDTFIAAMGKFVEMREVEGKALKDDVLKRVFLLQEFVRNIEKQTSGSIERYKEVLFSRLREAGLDLDLSDERVLKEIALFADRSDISEELIRLGSHIDQFLQNADKEELVGRKLDFICQEINRELNTIGSKSCLVSITNFVIEAKNELERIREQIQNIE